MRSAPPPSSSPPAASGDASTTGSTSSASGNAGDLKILNYALTLEFLEADFYDKVINSGLVKDKATVELAKKFGSTEQEHVDALSQAITQMGGMPVKAPAT